MAWESKYVNFGVLKIEGNLVRVHFLPQSYVTIDVGERPVSANWSNGEINIALSNGKVRRYSSYQSYITI